MAAATFDPELIEYTLYPDAGPASMVEIYKVGGGTLGEAYEGLWGYRLTGNDQFLASGEDLRTGMPHTHWDAALLVIEIVDHDKE